MFAHREARAGGVDTVGLDIAFTDRHGITGALDLQWEGAPGSAADGSGLEAIAQSIGGPVVGMRQVHGTAVVEVDGAVADASVEADAILTRTPGVTLLVRVADCVPILLADQRAGVVGAVHAGRQGVLLDVVGAAVERMRALGAQEIEAWVGPHVCGVCYEVPGAMQDEVVAAIPATKSVTSWGTPALDLGAGVRAQLEAAGVPSHSVDRCTREDEDLWSYRRQGADAGRLGGLIRMVP
ncbi:polyphenol oxidase family protein [Nocardioides sp. AE5]|uniref:polyphenol oxidase family protein n=1 Tax=Nocardioides sp. AE5 TaxID=2962573 RepID=UPI002881793C|nr:polyphenol oxidase family protein [Nocardioides sp. AE5]MDT0201261.1 polyphenol oxidase family protein [Nocardioides sp. AE5]